MAMPREEFNERAAEKLQAATAREEAAADDTYRLYGEAGSRRSWEQHAESDEFRERVPAKLDEMANRPRPRPMTREEFLEATAGYDE